MSQKFATTALDGKIYQVEHYNLDMIICCWYRVKSNRGVEFRKCGRTKSLNNILSRDMQLMKRDWRHCSVQ
ncbi:MAG: RhuM family protein [Blautia wexlerae]